MIAALDVKLALRGLLAFARFDRTGTLFFDPTPEGAARSFNVYWMALPLFALITSLQLARLKPEQDSVLITLALLVGYLMRCVAFPLYVHPVLRWMGKLERWPRMVSGYNWLSVTQYAGFALLMVLGRLGLPDGLLSIATVGILVFSILVEGFMFEAILESGIAAAIALVLGDLVVGEAIDSMGRSFF